MFRENIGENLRMLRKNQKNISVARLVDKINENGYELSTDTYYKWERGTRKPPCEAIPYIAQALGVSEGKIFHLHEAPDDTDAAENQTRLFEEIKNLSPEVKEVMSWLAAQWSRNVEAYVYFLGMYAVLNKRDRSLISGLTIRLYENAKKYGTLEKDCKNIDFNYTQKAWEQLKNEAYRLDFDSEDDRSKW